MTKSNGQNPDGSDGSPVSTDEGSVNSSRRDFLRNIGLGAAAVVVGGGTGLGLVGLTAAWTGKQAMDAAKPALQEFVLQEWLQRSGVAKEFLDEAAETSKELAVALLNFLVVLKEKVTTWEGAFALVVTLWEGLKRDAKDWLTTGNTEPDQIIEQVGVMIDNDPALKTHWDTVESLVEKMKTYEARLDTLATELVTADEADAEEAWEIYKKHFWQEVQKEFGD